MGTPQWFPVLHAGESPELQNPDPADAWGSTSVLSIWDTSRLVFPPAPTPAGAVWNRSSEQWLWATGSTFQSKWNCKLGSELVWIVGELHVLNGLSRLVWEPFHHVTVKNVFGVPNIHHYGRKYVEYNLFIIFRLPRWMWSQLQRHGRRLSSFILLLCVLVAQSCLTLCNPMACSPPGFSVHGILQARILEWIAIPFSRGTSQPRDWTLVSCITGRFVTIWPTGKSYFIFSISLFPQLQCSNTANLSKEKSDRNPETSMSRILRIWHPHPAYGVHVHCAEVILPSLFF